MLRIALVCVTLALASASLQAKWTVFKQQHGKSYGPEEDVIRRYIYQANLKTIDAHNERFANGETSFYMGENKFSDMTAEEVSRQMNGLRIKVPEVSPVQAQSTEQLRHLPATVDWRTKGYVTPVKDQGQCGSCWAFSTTGSLEGAHFKSTGKLVSLSESNLVDCSKGNFGCAGGLMVKAFEYVIKNHGIDTEKSYSYVPRDRKCEFNRAHVGATISSFAQVTSGSEAALQNASALIGPISVGIDAAEPSFVNYAGGVYDEPNCSSVDLDHGVLVVGYGTENGKDYWLVKNSWSEGWGDHGYIKMSRNKNNQCGIATAASFPIV